MAGVENRLSRSLLVGALSGVTSWTAYAIAECCFASLLPLVIGTGFVDSAAHRRFALVIFGIYLFTGLILGGLAGAAFHTWRNIASRRPRAALFTEETVLPSVATGTVVIVFTAHLITVLGHASRLLWATLGLALLLALAILLSAAKASWFGRLAFLTNPWVVSFALLGPGWAARGVLARYPQHGAVVVAALCPAILILASLLIHRVAGCFLQSFSPARWACLTT